MNPIPRPVRIPLTYAAATRLRDELLRSGFVAHLDKNDATLAGLVDRDEKPLSPGQNAIFFDSSRIMRSGPGNKSALVSVDIHGHDGDYDLSCSFRISGLRSGASSLLHEVFFGRSVGLGTDDFRMDLIPNEDLAAILRTCVEIDCALGSVPACTCGLREAREILTTFEGK